MSLDQDLDAFKQSQEQLNQSIILIADNLVTKVDSAEKGAANGVATLGSDGKVPVNYLTNTSSNIPTLTVNTSEVTGSTVVASVNIVSNGYSMSTVTLRYQIKNITLGTDWVLNKSQTFTNGTTNYSMLLDGLNANTSYSFSVYLTDSNNTNLNAKSNEVTFNTLAISIDSDSNVVVTGTNMNSTYVDLVNASFSNNTVIADNNNASATLKPVTQQSGQSNFKKIRPTIIIKPKKLDISTNSTGTNLDLISTGLSFIGEVSANSFITGDTLASGIGLSAGTSQFSTEPWLRFNDNGRDIYIAKKPFRHSISWDQLNTVGAVYGSKTVTIGGKLYKVRLLRGGNGDPTTGGTYYGYNTTEHQGSEWNRYMYPIHSTTHVSASNLNTSVMGTLAQYTDEQLHLHNSYGNGTYNWCQEVSGAGASLRVLRGGYGVAYGLYHASSSTDTTHGWRPLLEEVKVNFLGETHTSSLISGDALASAIGLTAGTSQFSTEPWLHFNDNGRDVYIAKKPFRHSVSWDQLNAVGAVKGNAKVTINGKQYRVRLLRGGNGDPTTGGTYSGYNTTEHQGSEWNRYMYPIHSTTHVNTSNPNTSDMGTLAQYTDEQLHVHYNYGNGTYSWCQEVSGAGASNRVLRGNGGVTYGNHVTSSNTTAGNGWRPLLEPIDGAGLVLQPGQEVLTVETNNIATRRAITGTSTTGTGDLRLILNPAITNQPAEVYLGGQKVSAAIGSVVNNNVTTVITKVATATLRLTTNEANDHLGDSNTAKAGVTNLNSGDVVTTIQMDTWN